MAKIFQLEKSTLFMCDGCLNDLGPIPGKWVEQPLNDCSICGEIDLRSREEMDQFHHDMSNLQYEDYDQGQYDDDPNPYSGTYSEE